MAKCTHCDGKGGHDKVFPEPTIIHRLWTPCTECNGSGVIPFRCVEVIDEQGRTSDGGLVLDKECFKALKEVLNWRCGSYHSSHAGMLVDAANKLGDTIYQQLGLEFQIYS